MIMISFTKLLMATIPMAYLVAAYLQVS